MAYTGRTTTITGTVAVVQAALTALATADTILGASITPLGKDYIVCAVAMDIGAAGGQTATIVGGTPAVVNAALLAEATASAASVDVFEMVALGDAYYIGLIVRK